MSIPRLDFSGINHEYTEKESSPSVTSDVQEMSIPLKYMIPCSFGRHPTKRFSAAIIEEKFTILGERALETIQENPETTEVALGQITNETRVTENNCLMSERRRKSLEKIRSRKFS